MSLSINDSLQNNSPKPLDAKYGIFATGAFRPYNNVAEANATIPAAYRSVGLTTLVNIGGSNVEYWYLTGIADGNLVVKSPTATVNTPLTITTGVIGIQVATTAQPGYLSNSDWNTFNSKVSGITSSGTGISLYIGTTTGVASFKSIAAGAGISLSDSGTTVTITASTVSAVNLGSGAGIFASNSGLNLQLRSIVAGGGITVTQNSNNITLGVTGGLVASAPATTTNATPATIASVPIPDNSVGILQVLMVGLVSGTSTNCTSAMRYVQYVRNGGVITLLGPVGDLIPEVTNGSFTTTSWTIVVDGSNAALDVVATGQASTNIEWNAYINTITNT